MRRLLPMLGCVFALALTWAQEPATHPSSNIEQKTVVEPVSQPAASPAVLADATKATVVAPDEFRSKDNFHIVGLPNIKRNGRVDVLADKDELRFEHDGKIALVIPYSRLQNVEVISGERHYGKATYAAAIATPFGLGSLLILKKRPVDTMVLEFTNQRGGVMNAVLQFSKGEGVRCGEFMSRHGIEFQEQKNSPHSEAKK